MTDYEPPAIPDRWDGQRWLRWDPKSRIWYDAPSEPEPVTPGAHGSSQAHSQLSSDAAGAQIPTQPARPKADLGRVAGMPTRVFASVGAVVAAIMVLAGIATTGAIAMPAFGGTDIEVAAQAAAPEHIGPTDIPIPPAVPAVPAAPAAPDAPAAPPAPAASNGSKLAISERERRTMLSSASARAASARKFAKDCATTLPSTGLALTKKGITQLCQCIAERLHRISTLKQLKGVTNDELNPIVAVFSYRCTQELLARAPAASLIA